MDEMPDWYKSCRRLIPVFSKKEPIHQGAQLRPSFFGKNLCCVRESVKCR